MISPSSAIAHDLIELNLDRISEKSQGDTATSSTQQGIPDYPPPEYFCSHSANPTKLINKSFATQSKNPVPVKVLGFVHIKNKGK